MPQGDLMRRVLEMTAEMRIIAVVFALLVYVPTLCLGQALPDAASVKVPMHPQQTINWCWAASAQMIMEYLGRKVTQCEEANQDVGRGDCCNMPTPFACFADGSWPRFAQYGFSYKTTSDAPLSWDQIRNQIGGQKKPFAVTWAWRGGGGHMMVATGFYTASGVRYVSISDPLPPGIGDQRDITYEEYVQGSDHTHWNDYYDITPVVAMQPNPPGQPPKASVVPSKPVDLKTAVVQSRNAANTSLEAYRKLAAQKEGPGAAAADARLGDPLPIVWIGLNELREPPGGDPVRTLRNETDKILYPVLSAERVRSAITLQKKDDTWETTSYGNAALARLLVEARTKFAANARKAVSDFYVVSIPALNAYFVATKTDADVFLMPVIDDPTMDLKAGSVQGAKDLMPRLVQAARKHTGKPR